MKAHICISITTAMPRPLFRTYIFSSVQIVYKEDIRDINSTSAIQCILIYVDINLNLTPTNITSYSTFIQIAKLYLLKVEKMQNPGECYIHLQRINMITRSYQLHSWLEKLRFFLLDVYVETFVWQQIRKFESKAHIVFENFALIYVYKLNFLQMSVHSV